MAKNFFRFSPLPDSSYLTIVHKPESLLKKMRGSLPRAVIIGFCLSSLKFTMSSLTIRHSPRAVLV